MPKVFRRSWERQRYGRAGAISSVLSARTGTDGVISGGSFAAPTKIFTSATANFQSTDVGRKIRLTLTPGTGRYDGLYVIDSINSTTSVNLRFNHNVGGTPTSDAKFYENGTTITWKICESATFTADVAGDMEDFYPGSYIFIESSISGNKGLWLISHRIDSQTVLLAKSYVMFVYDNGSPWTHYVIDAPEDFSNETGLKWYVIDRQPMSPMDWFEIFIQNCIDMGWTMYQQRGYTSALQIYKDVVLKSTGEPDAQIPGGKAMFLRYTLAGLRSSFGVINGSGITVVPAIYQHWDPTLTATLPGLGVGGCRGSNNFNSGIAAQVHNNASFSNGNNFAWNQYPWKVGSTSYNERGRGDIPDSAGFFDYSMFGDRDEVFAHVSQHAYNTGTSSARIHFGHLKSMGANPNIVTVINNVTAGTNKDLNVGTVDMQALTPPYAVGDNITVIGRKSSNPAEFIETTTIVSFNNTDPSNRLVRVANLSMAFGNGPDTLKLQCGEDPFPVFLGENTTTSSQWYLHNLSKQAVGTTQQGSPGRDYDTVNFGSSSTIFDIWSGGFSEIDPNRKTGRFGLMAVGIRNTGTGEFRGRARYYWDVPDYRWSPGAKIVVNGTDVYVVTGPVYAGETQAMGPMTKNMAAVFS